MREKFEGYIRAEFAKTGDESADLRNAAYQRLRNAIVKKAQRPDGTVDASALKRWMSEFEAACAGIEDDYSEPDLSGLGSPDTVNSGLAGLLGIAGAATAIGSGIDFFSVVLNDALGLSAMAVYMLAGIGCGAASLILSRLSSFASFSSVLRTGFQASVAIACVGAVALGLTFTSPEARERGLIAAFFPGAAEAQDTLLGRLEKTALETVETTKRIEEKVSTLKKETSDDPCKELVNLGYACNLDSIHRAVLEGNARVVGLYLDAGETIPAETIAWLLMKPYSLHEDAVEQTVAELLAEKDQIDRRICTQEQVNLAIRVWKRSEFLADREVPDSLRSFYRGLCAGG